MENLDLLSELVKQFEEEKIILNGELASLLKEQAEITGKQEAISNKISAKKAEAASISKERIEEYKAFWKSLSTNNAPPCPFCFMVHDRQSDLQPLPEREGAEHFKCRVCGKYFHVPLPSFMR